MVNQPSINKASASAGLTARHIADRIGLNSSQVNELFQKLGWIAKSENGWETTDVGVRAGGRNHRGSTAPFVKWPETVLQHPEFKRIVNDRTGSAPNPPVDSAPAGFTARQLAERIGCNSSQVNELFERLGWIVKFENGWKVTDAGARFGGENHRGSTAPFVKWPKWVLQLLDFKRIVNERTDSAPTPPADSAAAGFTARQLAERIGCNSSQINELFERLGWIVKFENGWKVTDAGVRAGGENHRGSTAPYVRWPETVLDRSDFKRIVNERIR